MTAGLPISVYAARYGVDMDLLTRGAGFGYIGSTITSLFIALPPTFVVILAGLALISAFTTGFMGIFKDSDNIEAGIFAFLATASGMDFLGLGAPFWGLLFGGIMFLVLAWRTPKPQSAGTK